MEISLREEINCLLEQRRSFWVQRARRKKLNQGDANARYFHALASAQQRRKLIHGIKDERQNWITEPDQLCYIFQQFFEKQSKARNNDLRSFMNLNTQTLSEDDNQTLIKPVEDDEIRNAIFAIGSDKAPGPFF